jgi:hypothetical protein
MHEVPSRKARCSRRWHPSTNEAPDRKMGCKRVGRQCTKCPAARLGAHGVDTRRQTKCLIARWGANESAVDARSAQPQGQVLTALTPVDKRVPHRKMGCKRVGSRCTKCPAARPGAHGVDTRRHTRRLIARWGAKRVGSRLRHFAARQACLSNRQVLSRTNHGVVFMGADSLVTVSMVTQQSITGVVHVRLAVRRPHTGPDLPAARAVGKGVLKCGAQGFGLA